MLGADWWLANINKRDILKILPEDSFWIQVSIAWSSSNYHQPKDIVQVAKQFLWFNSHIRIGHKPVWFRAAWQAGVKFVADIIDEQDGTTISYDHFVQKFGRCLNFVKFYGLPQALPKAWTTLLMEQNNQVDPEQLKFELLFYSVNKKLNKEIYNNLIRDLDKKIILNLQQKWTNKLAQFDDCISLVEIEKCFQDLYVVSPAPKYRSFQYRLLHCRIFLNENLYKWKVVDSSRCTYCHDHYETIEHFFTQCHSVKRFWTQLQAWFECLTDTEITLTPKRIIFNNFEDIEFAGMFNAVILMAKQYLYSCRCLDKEYGFYTFKENLFQVVKYERIEALYKGKNKKKAFCKKWAPLLK